MAKMPLVLVPGLLCTDDLWRDQLGSLAELAEPQITDRHYAYDNLTAIAQAILAAAPPNFALAGLSMGGYVAFEILRQAADRVSRLALLDTSARPDTEQQTKRRRDLIQLANMGKFRGVTPQLLPLLVHRDRLSDRPLIDRIVAMAETVGRDAFLRQQTAIMARPDSRPMLPGIRVPTLVLCGDADQITPPDAAREMAEGIPGAELVLVPECGHMSTMERPEIVNAALIRWLSA